ncbi:MAG: WG repeat-containing protein, partial [Mycoplasma sp.]|nr:WG repeat-containing protein [Mycoplasma sp.]
MNKYFFLLVMSVSSFVCSSARGDVGGSGCEILLQDSVKQKTKVPEFIPRKKGNLYGFVNQAGQFVIPPVYSNVSFFGEDCRLIASPNESVRQYGDSSYATVSKGDKDYRIDEMGREVYAYEIKDLVPCKLT